MLKLLPGVGPPSPPSQLNPALSHSQKLFPAKLTCCAEWLRSKMFRFPDTSGRFSLEISKGTRGGRIGSRRVITTHKDALFLITLTSVSLEVTF
ncbi:hypothetical protein JTE90_013781 [Oedothorax gibbosus]|uniref:Uncharacterized protein n=1 Tax=Oedothorax gibbosus TaxID=931172 RepID=A0AAV6UZX4_9ARAC|nr:hypothetical protein JTE90_013781 [Oedothorax gibbosus]